jgi:hypothetical protein
MFPHQELRPNNVQNQFLAKQKESTVRDNHARPTWETLWVKFRAFSLKPDGKSYHKHWACNVEYKDIVRFDELFTQMLFNEHLMGRSWPSASIVKKLTNRYFDEIWFCISTMNLNFCRPCIPSTFPRAQSEISVIAGIKETFKCCKVALHVILLGQ